MLSSGIFWLGCQCRPCSAVSILHGSSVKGRRACGSILVWYCLVLQAVLTLAMTAVHNRPQDMTLLSHFLCHGLACAVANIPCHNKDIFSTALSCADALVGEHSFPAFPCGDSRDLCVQAVFRHLKGGSNDLPLCQWQWRLSPYAHTQFAHS